MPREAIESTGSNPNQVKVGWRSQGGVQVGVTPPGDAAEEGLWADLDRQGCNDLIRILRRARDSAFGRDE